MLTNAGKETQMGPLRAWFFGRLTTRNEVIDELQLLLCLPADRLLATGAKEKCLHEKDQPGNPQAEADPPELLPPGQHGNRPNRDGDLK